MTTNRDASRSPPPTRRLLALGASNLARARFSLVDHWGRLDDDPVALVGVWGRGRSYGQTSLFCGRSLPGILQADVWSALERAAPLPTRAWITDVGNDLMYGVPPAVVAEWVERVVDRLTGLAAEITLTALPLSRLDEVGQWGYATAKTLFFPASGPSWGQALAAAEELDDRLRRLAQERGLRLVIPDRGWYGLDPIHWRRTAWPEVWQSVWGAAVAGHGAGSTRGGWREREALRWARAAKCRVWGRRWRRAASGVRWASGSSLELY